MSQGKELCAEENCTRNRHRSGGTLCAQHARKRVLGEWKLYFGDESLQVNWQRFLHDLGMGDFTTKTKCKKVSGTTLFRLPLQRAACNCQARLMVAIKQALQHVWININDFLEQIRMRDEAAMNLGDDAAREEALQQPIKVDFFPTQRALAEYTIKSGKVFPRRHITKESPLKLLLAEILYPGRRRGKKAV